MGLARACLLSWMLLAPAAGAATHHALLIGIGDYPTLRALEGPLNDVALMHDTLTQYWGFRERDIRALTNAEASRQNILAAIDELAQRAAPGDIALIYFSGHGTSAADTTSPASLPTKSGALVPHDIAGIETAQALSAKLIVGRRDLQPALARLDRAGVGVLVILDACYSGNAIRDRRSGDALPTRFVRFRELLPTARVRLEKRREFAPDLPFPYRNVALLAAAQEYEATQDIPAARLNHYPTLDGKAHGAFTDSLARVLRGDVAADANGDRELSLHEVWAAVRTLMRERRFAATPRLLPDADTGTARAARALFAPPLDGGAAAN